MSDTTIQFNDVSKKYRLGMTRTSVPTLISGWAKSAFRKKEQKASSDAAFWALRNVSFDLKKGESLALVGSNGAGKTTTLKLLAQITKPTSGNIKVNGTLSALIELGAGFHPDLSGRENIYLNGAILGLKKHEIQRRFDGIVSFAELEKFIDTPLKRYSSGMAVRLGFAVAASVDPDIMLVDEVLAVGDVSFRLKCMTRIQELLDNGTTLIFVSHNMGLVKAVCQLGMYIDHGQVKYFGSSGEAIDAYNKALNEIRASQFEGRGEAPPMDSANAEIVKLEVSCPEAVDPGVLMTNRPAKISLHYKAYEDIGDVSVNLHVFRSDGIGCIKLYSRLDDAQITLTKGQGEISADLVPLQLVPGKYSVVATLKNKIESHTYSMSYSEWFQVEDEIAGSDDLESVYVPKHFWHHEPVLREVPILLQSKQQ
jgi:lipopolysaccharide transport system ATP-binding protein